VFRLFAEKELDEVLRVKAKEMQAELYGKPDDYILNVNETDYINYLVDCYTVENLELKFDDICLATYEKDIPAERFPSFLFNVERGRAYRKDVIRYHIPFTGDEELLRCTPNPRILWTIETAVEGGCVCFDIVNFYDDSQRKKQEAESIITSIKRQSDSVTRQVASYNALLPTRAQELFQARKQHLLRKNDLLAALGVPVRKREHFPQTFAIPTPQTRKKIRIAQPMVVEKGYKPEPTLDLSVYEEILQVIHDVGKQFERMPSTYANKSEEDLRDHILLVLEPRFEGSATGETFNKTGKTDILLRYQGSNVFIAECKFWKGVKSYLDAVSQLFGYLTWRDSKAAVVVFVQNKDFSSVIKTVEAETPRHPNYLGFASKRDETWLNYRFHITGDCNREASLAILLFHIPPV
jgi:RecB family endonuclease NucS